MMEKTKLLFVCSSNLDRSPLAESLFANSQKYEAKSCGIYPHANAVISKKAILWADLIFCMEEAHREHIVKNFPDESRNKKVVVLGIPTFGSGNHIYSRNDPELLYVMKEKLGKLLGVRFV